MTMTARRVGREGRGTSDLLTRSRVVTQQAHRALRDAALSAYDRLRRERFEERERYRGMALRDALRLKLERVLGVGYDIAIGAGGSERERFAEIDGLRFLGVRLPDGDVGVVWVARCPRCGEEKGGRFLEALTDLGEEIAQFRLTGRVGGHQCPGVPDYLRAADPPP